MSPESQVLLRQLGMLEDRVARLTRRVKALEKTVASVEREMLAGLRIQDQQIEALRTRPSPRCWVGLAFDWMLVVAVFGAVVFTFVAALS
jgi:hypothetical protein